MPSKLPLAPGVKYRRILLKLSGEALMGSSKFGLDQATLSQIADELIDVHGLGVEIALVIGGGNIFRGWPRSAGMDRAHADYMGMLATVINSLALQDALESRGSHTRVLSAIEMERDGRAVHPPPRHPPPREGAAGDLRGRHRQPVLHDRHGGVAARHGDRRRDRHEGDARSTASTTRTRTSSRTRACSGGCRTWTC